MSIYVNPQDLIKESESRYLRFKTYLKEANHGIFNKDPRFKIISDGIYESIKKQVDFQQFKDSVYFDIETQSPARKDTIELQVKWEIKIETLQNSIKEKFVKYASVMYSPLHEVATLEIILLRSFHQTDANFKKELMDFVENGLKHIIYHEVKHILDRIDERNTNMKIPNISQLNYETGKYQTMNSEIYNFLLTLIGEFESIERKHRGISFSDAISLSKQYSRILDPMPINKKNKLKSKLIDFWIDNYGMGRLH